jgi:hypothetical protein
MIQKSVFLLLIVLLKAQMLFAAETLHVCYFSMNNQKEIQILQSLFAKLNKVQSQFNFSAQEYLTENGVPSVDFLKMVSAGTKCDGLVITGHHTGSFGGERARGSLNIDFLENLSVHPEYRNWFSQIKAVWLQGCRTLSAKLPAGQTADGHANRVGQDIEADGLETDLAGLARDFSLIFDQDNPLAERYIRVFSASTVFGWTQSAPGTKAESEQSIPVHFAMVARAKGELVRDPRKNLRPKDAPAMSSAAAMILTQSDEFAAIQAWTESGKNVEIGFENNDVAAIKSSPLEQRQHFESIRILQSRLRNYSWDSYPDDLERALQSPESLRYLTNDLLNGLEWLGQNQSPRNNVLRTNVIARLRGSQEFISLLDRRLNDQSISLLSQLETYRTMRVLSLPREKFYKSLLQGRIVSRLALTLLSKDRNAISRDNDFRKTLLRIAYEAQLFDESLNKKLMSLPESSQLQLSGVTELRGQPLPFSGELIKSWLQSNNTELNLEASGILVRTPHSYPEALYLDAYVILMQKEAARRDAMRILCNEHISRSDRKFQIERIMNSDAKLRSEFFANLRSCKKEVMIGHLEDVIKLLSTSNAYDGELDLMLNAIIYWNYKVTLDQFQNFARMVQRPHEVANLLKVGLRSGLYNDSYRQISRVLLESTNEDILREFRHISSDEELTSNDKQILLGFLEERFKNSEGIDLIADDLRQATKYLSPNQYEQLKNKAIQQKEDRWMDLVSEMLSTTNSHKDELQFYLKMAQRLRNQKNGHLLFAVNLVKANHQIANLEIVLDELLAGFKDDAVLVKEILVNAAWSEGPLNLSTVYIDSLLSRVQFSSEMSKALLLLLVAKPLESTWVNDKIAKVLSVPIDFYYSYEEDSDEPPEFDEIFELIELNKNKADYIYALIFRLIEQYPEKINGFSLLKFLSQIQSFTDSQKQTLAHHSLALGSPGFTDLPSNVLDIGSIVLNERWRIVYQHWMTPFFMNWSTRIEFSQESKNRMRVLIDRNENL